MADLDLTSAMPAQIATVSSWGRLLPDAVGP
jgi:hypothetical protein